MEYAAALEERSTKKEGRILELEASLDSQTTLTLPTELVASVAASTAATSNRRHQNGRNEGYDPDPGGLSHLLLHQNPQQR